MGEALASSSLFALIKSSGLKPLLHSMAAFALLQSIHRIQAPRHPKIVNGSQVTACYHPSYKANGKGSRLITCTRCAGTCAVSYTHLTLPTTPYV